MVAVAGGDYGDAAAYRAVTMGMEPELQSVRADRNQIEQVIMNLAVNSRDAMPAGGELRIDTKNVHLDDAYSETILLVEDAEAIRKLAAEFLTSHGFEVLSASNAEEAVNIAAAHASAIQLLVTDVIMPG